jgi:rare lipoprotein A
MIRSDWMAAGTAAALLLAGAPAYAGSVKEISGVAAFYSADYRGRTASGERYDPGKFTCAHRSVVVTVNDRGPFNKGRVIDLSLAAAKALHMIDRGLIRVTAVVQQ